MSMTVNDSPFIIPTYTGVYDMLTVDTTAKCNNLAIECDVNKIGVDVFYKVYSVDHDGFFRVQMRLKSMLC